MYKKSSLTINLNYQGIIIPITIKKSRASKKLSLKPCFKTGGGKITIPKNLSYTQGKIFAEKYLSWLYSLLRKNDYITISNLKEIKLLGNNLQIKKNFNPNKKNIKLSIINNELIITGNIEHSSNLNKAFKKFITIEAKEYFKQLIDIKTQILGIKYNKLFIKDNISRWGSCSYIKNISINWRLAFAPKSVIDYIISHEVAHLIYFNHSKEFWSLVERLNQSYKEEKNWLKEYGHTLYKIII